MVESLRLQAQLGQETGSTQGHGAHHHCAEGLRHEDQHVQRPGTHRSAIGPCPPHACMGVTLQPRELPDGNALGSHSIATCCGNRLAMCYPGFLGGRALHPVAGVPGTGHQKGQQGVLQADHRPKQTRASATCTSAHHFISPQLDALSTHAVQVRHATAAESTLLHQVTYHITDVAPDKKDNAWGRVVAVFVQGKAWQFRDWPFQVRLDQVLLSWTSCHTCRCDLNDVHAAICVTTYRVQQMATWWPHLIVCWAST